MNKHACRGPDRQANSSHQPTTKSARRNLGEHEQIVPFFSGALDNCLNWLAEFDTTAVLYAGMLEVSGGTSDDSAPEIIEKAIVNRFTVKPSVPAHPPVLRPWLNVEQHDFNDSLRVQIEQVLDNSARSLRPVKQGKHSQCCDHRALCVCPGDGTLNLVVVNRGHLQIGLGFARQSSVSGR